MLVIQQYHMNGIMHKWANPHFDEFEKKIVQQHEVQDKTNKYKKHKKVTKSVNKWSNPQWRNSYIDQVVAINDTYFHCFLMPFIWKALPDYIPTMNKNHYETLNQC